MKIYYLIPFLFLASCAQSYKQVDCKPSIVLIKPLSLNTDINWQQGNNNYYLDKENFQKLVNNLYQMKEYIQTIKSANQNNLVVQDLK